jgi:hypothetical protein
MATEIWSVFKVTNAGDDVVGYDQHSQKYLGQITVCKDCSDLGLLEALKLSGWVAQDVKLEDLEFDGGNCGAQTIYSEKTALAELVLYPDN